MEQMMDNIQRHRQAVQDNILKSFLADSFEELSKGGVYVNNAQNRRLGRVGRQYGKEKKQDERYEEFVDAGTGEIVKMKVPNHTEKTFAKKESKAEERKLSAVEKRYYSAVDKEKALHEKYGSFVDEYHDCISDLRDKIRERRELEVEHEQAVGALYSDGKDEEAESLAQDYGERFNDLDDEIELLKKRRNKLQPKVNEYNKKLEKIWDY